MVLMAVRINNTLVCYTVFLAAATLPCVLIWGSTKSDGRALPVCSQSEEDNGISLPASS